MKAFFIMCLLSVIFLSGCNDSQDKSTNVNVSTKEQSNSYQNSNSSNESKNQKPVDSENVNQNKDINEKKETSNENKNTNTSETIGKEPSKKDKKEEVSKEVNEGSTENIDDNKDTSYASYTYNNYTLLDKDLDNTSIGWYFMRNKNFSRPEAAKSIDYLKEFNSYYIGKDEKVIYLTFDEGSPESFVEENLNTLSKYGVKATFFVTKGYIKYKPELVKRMVNEGHSVGNHTNTHPNMTTFAKGSNITSFMKEISDTEELFKETTGVPMNKLFRFPEGSFSTKALQLTKDMGYRSYFWSFAYQDWERDLNDKETALNWMESYYHNGAIYLIHGLNRANSEALGDFIVYMKDKGYSFGLVSDIK
jgi:peptidoglycan-N-acetylmuramic acid deacetylase